MNSPSGVLHLANHACSIAIKEEHKQISGMAMFRGNMYTGFVVLISS